MFCDTIWCGFDQDGAAMIYAAFIGLLGGLAALIGAVIIGLKQATILGEQTELQKGQAKIAQRALELEELKVRTDLFDRRFSVYEATKDYVGFILGTGHPPGMQFVPDADEQMKRETALQTEFLQAIDRSQFLFRSEVKDRLEEEIWKPANEVHLRERLLENVRQEPDRAQHIDKLLELRVHFLEVANRLTELFGDELRLGGGSIPATPADPANAAIEPEAEPA